MIDKASYVKALAPLYDAFKARDDLDRLVTLLLQPITQYGTGGGKLLDVGCGTAVSCLAFAHQGYEVTGVDASPEMLAQARIKPETADMRLLQADMRDLPSDLVDFDVVNWTGDVVNHLLTVEDVRTAIASSARTLRPGGILVFDANSLSTFITTYSSHHVQEQDDAVFAWLGETPQPERDGPAQARILAFHRHDDGHWQREEGLVQERHYGVHTILQAINDAGLEHLATYGLHGGMLVDPADEDQHVKMIYVARRSSRASDESLTGLPAK